MVNVNEMKWSFSRLNAFYTCKYAWYLTYVEKKQGLDNAFTQYGKFMHKLLEEYAKGETLIENLPDKWMRNYKKEVPLKFPKSKFCNMDVLYYSRGKNYLDEFEGFGEVQIISSEEKYPFEFNGYNSTAIIDLIVTNEDGEIEIIDHKSKSKFKSKRELREYLRQLYFYCIPIKELFDEYPKIMTFNLFQKQEMVSTYFNIDTLHETEQWVLKTIDLISKEKDWEGCYNQFFCEVLCGHRKTCMYNEF